MILSWLKAQRQETRWGIAVSVAVINSLRTLAAGTPDEIRRFLCSTLSCESHDLLQGAEYYVRMVHANHPEWPEPVRDFLLRSPEFVLPVLRTTLGGTYVKWLNEPGQTASRVDYGEVENAVRMLVLAAILPDPVAATYRRQVADFLAVWVPSHGIVPEARERASWYLESGEAAFHHPAYGFLSAIAYGGGDANSVRPSIVYPGRTDVDHVFRGESLLRLVGA